MEHYEPIMSFGQEAAETYDEYLHGNEDEVVDFLEQRAGGGPVLELAVGTGRIALPLADRGIQVDGIELSPHMVARLRAKPGGDRITVTTGDMAGVRLDGTYPLIYIVFNSLFNLLTQDDQVRCFENVAAHLAPSGSFVIEAIVPSFLYRSAEGQYVDAEYIGVDQVRLDVGQHDPVAQRLDESHVVLARDGVRLHPIVTRYAWPSELDLMARIAGLSLRERWGGWNGEHYDAGSENLVSVYGN